jgi:hypothetical protein
MWQLICILTLSCIDTPLLLGPSVPSDQDLNCLLFDSLGYFWPKCDQCRSRSDGTDVPADLGLHWSHTCKNVYISRKGLTGHLCDRSIYGVKGSMLFCGTTKDSCTYLTINCSVIPIDLLPFVSAPMASGCIPCNNKGCWWTVEASEWGPAWNVVDLLTT